LVHGKTVALRLPVDVQMLADGAVLSGSFPLAWKQFGLADPSFGIITVREPMKVAFRLNAVPEDRKHSSASRIIAGSHARHPNRPGTRSPREVYRAPRALRRLPAGAGVPELL